ncbi:diacylglycerol kinase family protein [Calidifontibacillus oryziterrae]|uniref:diacylglycerol kinase family protein n=1 Tax=Calidifontibacillus oryziterrae TaxID=1191699 RepID=UPI000303D877|nr:diacylglycerol kinase family protein [Calidifontibacillus oryziterrae]
MDFIAKEIKRLFQSFKYAFEGLKNVVESERNMQIHLAIACIVLFLGYIFSISKVEWIIIVLCIGIVFCLEIINSAIERTVDLVTEEYKPLAKQAKDFAAAAVFVFAIISVIIGVVIFLMPLLRFLNLLLIVTF